jgi:hypothetical protein
MHAIQPRVFLDDDPYPARPMAAHGSLVGFSIARTLWRFGFSPGSDLAYAFGVHASRPLWVLCTVNGRPIETALLRWEDRPPARFLQVLEVHECPI